MSLLRPAATLAAAVAAVLLVAAPASATPDPTPPPPPPVSTIVVQVCLSVTVEQVDEVLGQVDPITVLAELPALDPVTAVVGDRLVVDAVADLGDVRSVLKCPLTTGTPDPTTAPVPTTEPVPTTAPASTTVATTPPSTTAIVVPDAPTQVRIVPRGGVATGDGSTAS